MVGVVTVDCVITIDVVIVTSRFICCNYCFVGTGVAIATGVAVTVSVVTVGVIAVIVVSVVAVTVVVVTVVVVTAVVPVCFFFLLCRFFSRWVFNRCCALIVVTVRARTASDSWRSCSVFWKKTSRRSKSRFCWAK